MWDDSIPKAIVGKKIREVWISSGHLRLETDQGPVTFQVDGDCCSASYFHDIVGVQKLLDNGPVISVEEVVLSPGDPGYHDYGCFRDWSADKAPCGGDHDVLKVYGFRLVTEHPTWGEQSTVIAFRNDSNGYYGGWMEPTDATPREQMEQVTEDWTADA